MCPIDEFDQRKSLTNWIEGSCPPAPARPLSLKENGGGRGARRGEREKEKGEKDSKPGGLIA